MKFYIKLNHFAQYRSFKIRNESEGELFKIKGKFFLGLRTLKMKDMSGQTLYTIKRRFTLSFYRVYSVHNEIGEEVARVHRTFGSKKPFYNLYMKDEKVHFEGSLIDHTFSINDDDVRLASLSKGTFSFGEAYEIEVLTEKKPLLHLFIVIALDQMNHEKKKFKGDV
jgi:uncharacterized protein YxjI